MNINKTNLRRNGNLQYGNYPTKIILHHPEFNGTVEQLNEVMINDGFSMIGYNYYIRKDGTVWEGRPVDAIGANCYGQNASSIGLSFEGNFMTDVMSDAQFNTGVELCKYLMQQYKNIKEIGPHKKYYNTDCPGKNFPIDKMIIAASASGVANIALTSQPAPQVQDVNLNLIKLWDSGSVVKDIQEKFIKLGYKLIGGADGIFGQSTFDAVQHFQASKGLTVDGIVGPNTIAALNATIAAQSVIDINSYKYLQHELNVQLSARIAEDNVPGAITLSKCPLVKIGAQGNITKWIQNKLGIIADGIFGPQTKVAIQNFQAAHGLLADGIIGINTWKKLLGL